MFFLFIHVILHSGFGILLKSAKNRNCRLNPIGFVNYFTALIFSIFALRNSSSIQMIDSLSLIFGLVNGISYGLGFFLFTWGMRLSGIVITTAVLRLSMVLPIGFAIIVWREIPNFWQSIGILLTLIALPLLGSTQENKSSKELKSRVGIGLLAILLLFLNAGIGRVAMKAFNEMCPIDQKPIYLIALFGISSVISAIACIRERSLPRWKETFYGFLIGICNVVQSAAFLAALDRIEALIAFPVSGSGGVIFISFVGILLFREKLDRKAKIGVLITILALILVNLK